MNNPSISIVIPVYNYAQVVARAINSVLPQLDERSELLIINDGSTDNSDQIIRESIKGASKAVRYISKENGGPSSVRNIGIEESCGQYLIFLDADDELMPKAISAIRSSLSGNNPPQILAGRHLSIFPDGSEKLSRQVVFTGSKEKNFLAYVKGELRLANGSTVMAREIFKDLRYPEDLRQSEDVPVFAMALANYSATSIPAVLAKIYKSPTSLRHDYQKTCAVGIKPVKYLFESEFLPKQLKIYYSIVLSRRYLSMSRSAWLANEPTSCIEFFHRAIKEAPLACLQWTYFGKYLKAVLQYKCNSLLRRQR